MSWQCLFFPFNECHLYHFLSNKGQFHRSWRLVRKWILQPLRNLWIRTNFHLRLAQIGIFAVSSNMSMRVYLKYFEPASASPKITKTQTFPEWGRNATVWPFHVWWLPKQIGHLDVLIDSKIASTFSIVCDFCLVGTFSPFATLISFIVFFFATLLLFYCFPFRYFGTYREWQFLVHMADFS